MELSAVLAAAAAYLALVNLFAWVAFWLDKRQAQRSQWRISESTLLTLALVGGTIGAKSAQRRFRHKTRKQPFARILNSIVLLHVGIIAAFGYILAMMPEIPGRF